MLFYRSQLLQWLSLRLGGARPAGLLQCGRILLVGGTDRRFRNAVTHQPAYRMLLPSFMEQEQGCITVRWLKSAVAACVAFSTGPSLFFIVITALYSVRLASEDVSCWVWRRVHELLCSGSQSRRDWNCREWIQRSMYTVSTIKLIQSHV